MGSAFGNLRQHLRTATSAAHDLLDNTMRVAGGWDTHAGYSNFLTLQYSARLPVEDWLARHGDPDLIPPPQAPLIATDLAALGVEPPAGRGEFAPPCNDQSAVTGVAWVLSGSSLGNRAILKDLEASASGHDWPTTFLSDPAMLQYWTALRRRIERPATHDEREGAATAAGAVFDHFLAQAGASPIAMAPPASVPAPTKTIMTADAR